MTSTRPSRSLRIKGAKDVGKARRARHRRGSGRRQSDGAIIELNSRPTSSPRTTEFQKLADQIVDAALESKATDVDALKGRQAR